MSFTLSVEGDVVLDGSILGAYCRKIDGSFQWSTIDLNKIITNFHGCLHWGGGDFAVSAEDIRLEYGSILVASLRTVDGRFRQSALDLYQHIGNADGQLVFASNG